MASDKKVTVQTKWAGLWGDKIRCGSSEKSPSGTLYDVSKEGEVEVSEEHARELCATQGWRMKPKARTPIQDPPPKKETAPPPPPPKAGDDPKAPTEGGEKK